MESHIPPDEFKCPICLELLQQPIVASDGHTYDLHCLQQWMRENQTSPLTGLPMQHTTVHRNIALSKLIQEWEFTYANHISSMINNTETSIDIVESISTLAEEIGITVNEQRVTVTSTEIYNTILQLPETLHRLTQTTERSIEYMDKISYWTRVLEIFVQVFMSVCIGLLLYNGLTLELNQNS